MDVALEPVLAPNSTTLCGGGVHGVLFTMMAVSWINLLHYVWRYPIGVLILHGPRWFGGFAGATLVDICAELTSMPSSYWERNSHACALYVKKRVRSYILAFESFLQILVIAMVALCLLAWCFCVSIICSVKSQFRRAPR